MLVLRRRSALVAKPAPVAASPTIAVHQPQRRLRVTSVNAAVFREARAQEARTKIDAQLKLVSEAEAAIDAAHTKLEEAYKMIEAQMKLADLQVHSNGGYIAEIKEQWTNQTRDIDPKKFRNRVAAEVFWGSISVSVTKAKNFLSERELNDISDVKPGQLVGHVLKVKKIEPKRRSK